MADDRDFWQLLNLRRTEGKPVGLFGSDAVKDQIVTLDKRVVDKHLVLVSPSYRGLDKGHLREGQELPTLDGDEAVASQIQGEKVKHQGTEAAKLFATFKGRWPYVQGQIYWSDASVSKDSEIRHFDRVVDELTDLGEQSVKVPINPDVPNAKQAMHAAFYKAASEMRDRFKRESLEILKWVPTEARPFAQIVTLVDSPIWADLLYESDDFHADRKPGVEIKASYTQYVIVGECEPRRWQVYSSQGEYPMDIPREIDIEYLIDIDKKFIQDNTAIERLLAGR